MKKKILLFSSIGGAVLIAAIVLIICLCLPKGKAYRSINVYSVTGTVNVKRKEATLIAQDKMKLKNDDIVEVKEASSTILKLDSDKFIMAKENTTLKLIATGKKSNTKTRIIVEKGGIVVELKEKLKNTESFEIASTNSIMAIRGTQISFNVSVVDNKITTSLAVLDGNTEVYLFKNEKLNKTLLPENYSFSYTTDLSEAVEDINEFIDNSEKVDIADSDLETIFNVIKEELTSEEIDEIVDIINEFERIEQSEKVNGVIKFSFKSQPKYNEDPSTLIEIEEDYNDLGNISYLYSKTVDGEYKELSEIGTLDIGEWYIKLISKDNKAYRSDPLKFSVLQDGALDLKLSFSSDAGFMIDPKTIITTDKKVTEDIKFVYSTQRNGTFTEYDTMNPLGLGTWYCKVLETENYKSDVYEFEVVKREIELKLDFTDEFEVYCAFMTISVSDLDEFFNSDYASTPADIPADGYWPSDYKYYIIVHYDDPEDPEDDYSIVIDYGNKTEICSSDGSTGTLRYYIEYHLPEEFIVPEEDYELYTHSYNFKYNESFVVKGDNNNSTFYVTIDSFSPNHDDIMARIKVGDNEPVELEANNHYGGLYSVNVAETEYDVQFYMANTNYATQYIHVDTTNFSDTSGVTISSGNPEEAICTYHGDRRMNVYYDLNFDGNDEYSHIVVTKYDRGIERINHTKISTGAKKYAVIEDIYDSSCNDCDCNIGLIGIMKEIDGMIYVSTVVESPTEGINKHTPEYGALVTDGSNKIVRSYEYFERGNGYEIEILDGHWNHMNIFVTDDDFISENVFEKTLTDYDQNLVKVSGMAYGYIKISSLDIDGAFNDTVWEQVSQLLANSGITIEGTNMHMVDCVDFVEA
ncbi:MAG: hypothetical protein J6Y28_00305 [Acholeplasmatales bacterium]|nr:hypothetical protein [Acholeplasmatales bacterium]